MMKRMQNHLIQLCCCNNGFLSATQQHPMHLLTASDKMLELFQRCNSSLNLVQSPASLPKTIPVHYAWRDASDLLNDSLSCWKVPPPWSVSLFEKAMQVARCFLIRPSLLFHRLPVLLFLFTSGVPSSWPLRLVFFSYHTRIGCSLHCIGTSISVHLHKFPNTWHYSRSQSTNRSRFPYPISISPAKCTSSATTKA
jgi:hypothetical protein